LVRVGQVFYGAEQARSRVQCGSVDLGDVGEFDLAIQEGVNSYLIGSVQGAPRVFTLFNASISQTEGWEAL
jgi:hypothetical protein